MYLYRGICHLSSRKEKNKCKPNNTLSPYYSYQLFNIIKNIVKCYFNKH